MSTDPLPSRISERAVIAAVIGTAGAALDEISLMPSDFEHAAYRATYEKARTMRELGHPIDQFTLVDAFPDGRYTTEILEAAGDYVGDVGFYAEIVAGHALRRRLVEAGQAVAAAARSDMDTVALPDAARSLVDRAVGSSVARDLPTMADEFAGVLDRMRERPEVIPTPWPRVNGALSGGLREGRFYVVGARPGVGKSVIALQLAHRLSLRGRVLFVTLEMGKDEVTHRLWAQQVQIPLRAIERDALSEFMWKRLMQWRATDPLAMVIDEDSRTVWDVLAKARTIARQHGLAGVVVDYLQLMQDPRADAKRHEVLATMTRALKLMSRELSVPVIACSQLNRESSRRADGRPSLADLRESGSIEQDADVVMLLDRDLDDEQADLAIHLAKNRQGQTGLFFLRWQGEFVRAVDDGNAPAA